MRLKLAILTLCVVAAPATAAINPFDGKADSYNPSPQAYTCLGALTYAMKHPDNGKKALSPQDYMKARNHWSVHPSLNPSTPIDVQSEDSAVTIIDMDPKKRDKLIKRCVQDSGYQPPRA
ncbi:hypothetical protein [Asticcacaulis sp. YBE204]|uniref:hypothetical protein n=1 Tax=Asticcacaulis sp. YBE204 TaxID=1282363 RepID=UPI0003C3F7C1|nr:hypothetical protein [Asticcacaulis sp. YBE204]ESQ80195.1 hypothetical protein AEYBE204_06130 [Asticcacaulis sp. YBE204]